MLTPSLCPAESAHRYLTGHNKRWYKRTRDGCRQAPSGFNDTFSADRMYCASMSSDAAKQHSQSPNHHRVVTRRRVRFDPGDLGRVDGSHSQTPHSLIVIVQTVETKGSSGQPKESGGRLSKGRRMFMFMRRYLSKLHELTNGIVRRGSAAESARSF